VTRVPAVGAALLLVALATVTTADSDLWGHLRFGLDMIATHELPSVDPYSFTQDTPWVNHEWLSELVTAIAWTAAATPGLAVLKGSLVALALWLVWQGLRETVLGARFVLFAAVAASTVPVARTLRPQLWTLLFLVVLCRLLGERRARAMRWLPLLFAVWANMHGGWIVGLGVLGAWTAADVLASRRIPVEPILVLGASALATLLNPYGWGMWGFLGSTVRMGRDITEWQPLWNTAPADAVPWLVTVATVAWLVRIPVRDRWPRLAVLIVLAYASARVVRIVPLFVACAGVLLAEACASRWPRGAASRTLDPSPHDRLAAAVIGAVTVAAAVWVASSSLRCVAVATPRAPDALAMRLLHDAPPGRLVTFFDWGQYALWHVGPRLRVSIDGRRETIYSDARLAEHAAILEGYPEGFAVLASWRPEYVWLPATSARTREWLVSQGYRVEHESDRSFVAVRSDLPRLTPAAPADPAAMACFPG